MKGKSFVFSVRSLQCQNFVTGVKSCNFKFSGIFRTEEEVLFRLVRATLRGGNVNIRILTQIYVHLVFRKGSISILDIRFFQASLFYLIARDFHVLLKSACWTAYKQQATRCLESKYQHLLFLLVSWSLLTHRSSLNPAAKKSLHGISR